MSEYWVVMGDLIGSEKATDVLAQHVTFNSAIAAANETFHTQLVSPLTITLGDEFQGLTTKLADASLISRHLRLDLLKLGLRCRFVVGRIDLATPLNTQVAWNMMGAGLGAARDRLNDKSDENAHRYVLPREPVTEALLNAVGQALTDLEDGWSPKQLPVVVATFNQSLSVKDMAGGSKQEMKRLYKLLETARIKRYRLFTDAIDKAL